MTYWLTPERADVTRLDRLAKRSADVARRGATASRATVALFSVAVVLALLAVVPTAPAPDGAVAKGGFNAATR